MQIEELKKYNRCNPGNYCIFQAAGMKPAVYKIVKVDFPLATLLGIYAAKDYFYDLSSKNWQVYTIKEFAFYNKTIKDSLKQIKDATIIPTTAA